MRERLYHSFALDRRSLRAAQTLELAEEWKCKPQVVPNPELLAPQGRLDSPVLSCLQLLLFKTDEECSHLLNLNSLR